MEGNIRVRKNAPIRTALIRTPFKDWPQPMRNNAAEMLHTVRGKRILEDLRKHKRGSKQKLVDLVLEPLLSLEDL